MAANYSVGLPRKPPAAKRLLLIVLMSDLNATMHSSCKYSGRRNSATDQKCMLLVSINIEKLPCRMPNEHAHFRVNKS